MGKEEFRVKLGEVGKENGRKRRQVKKNKTFRLIRESEWTDEAHGVKTERKRKDRLRMRQRLRYEVTYGETGA